MKRMHVLRRPVLLLSAVLAFSACERKDQPAVTEAEKIVARAYAEHRAAAAFDEVCNKADPKKRMDAANPANANWIGNAELLAGRVIAARHARYPDKSFDDLAASLRTLGSEIQKQNVAIITDMGCGGTVGENGQKALDYYANTPPDKVAADLDAKLAAAGASGAAQ